ncbi:hypothetical protein NLJ89_g10694 [Agrocybe chaxingu]|uniref:DNA 3'-5' helicase n=1 Tax=Agrocybe chaxingu TaxID=84603 RepID=A0A9W8MNP2_9AGAR|nr:hypothetical protein NLJ89_g10694 [Agrocybe chaxingu]
MASTSSVPCVPLLSEIRNVSMKVLGIRPCLWQLKVVQAILRGNKHIVSIAGTAGSIQIVITPLNLLGKQNVACLEKAGFRGIFISAESASAENFRAIEDLQYQAVIINPEQAVKEGGHFERIAKNPGFAGKVISTIFDEAHCIGAWGTFRPEYSQVGRLRLFLPKSIPVVLTSATLPELVFHDVLRILGLEPTDVEILRQSTDRPNIHIFVRPINSSLSSFSDLSFLLKGWKPGDPPPPKFLIFFDNIADSIKACLYLRSLLPPEYRHKINWFNSEMSSTFKRDETQNLATGVSWGENATESFGMGIDISDIKVVVQWRATCSMSTLWQRLGRAGRDRSSDAYGIFLVEKEHFDEEKAKKTARKLRRATKKRRRTGQPSPRKQAKTPAAPSPAPNQEIDQDGDNATSSESESEAEISVQLNERYTTKATDKVDKKKKQALRELEPVMDDFINAKTRRIPCRRGPSNTYFQNNQASADHLTCDETRPGGCARCSLPPPTICCDVHTPTAFVHFDVPRQKSSRLPARSTLDTKYTMTPADNDLYEALDAWRILKTETEFGYATLVDLGASLVMPSDTLERIMHCAHHCKIRTVADLKKETRWDEADNFGNEVVALILRIRPPPALPPPTTTVPRPLATVSLPNMDAPVPVVKERAKTRCGACGTVGHNRANRWVCTKHPDYVPTTSMSAKENVTTS